VRANLVLVEGEVGEGGKLTYLLEREGKRGKKEKDKKRSQ